MKTRGESKGLSTAPLRNELPSPEHVLERIRTITGELDALRAEIYGQIDDPAELLKRRSLLEQAGSAGVLVNFKLALDELRSILWFCDSRVPMSSNDTCTDRDRELARASELLKALSTPGPSASSQAQSGSFFERLDRVIDNYMQERASPRNPVTRSKA